MALRAAGLAAAAAPGWQAQFLRNVGKQGEARRKPLQGHECCAYRFLWLLSKAPAAVLDCLALFQGITGKPGNKTSSGCHQGFYQPDALFITSLALFALGCSKLHNILWKLITLYALNQHAPLRVPWASSG